MDELRKLQQMLCDVQKQTSSQFRLSEANTIEIVQLLRDLNLLEVFHTLDGKDYMTPQRLEEEIAHELQMHAGRISVNELPALINVEHSLVAKAAQRLASRLDTIHSVEGELLSSEYIDSLAAEIHETLEAVGCLGVGEIASRFQLQPRFVLQLITSRAGESTAAHIDAQAELVYTDDYIEDQRAAIRGAFTALTRPTHVPQMISKCGFNESLFHGLLQSLIDSGRLDGRVSKQQYVPASYTRHQTESLQTFYDHNGFLTFDALRAAEVPPGQERSYLTSRFPDGCMLSTLHAGPALVAQADAAMEDADQARAWVDLLMALPAPLTEVDLAPLLSRAAHPPCKPPAPLPADERTNTAPSGATGTDPNSFAARLASLLMPPAPPAGEPATMQLGSYVVSRAAFERALHASLVQLITAFRSARTAEAAAPSPPSASPAAEPASQGKGRKGKGRNAAPPPEPAAESEEEEAPAKRGRRGKRRGRNAGGKSASTSTPRAAAKQSAEEAAEPSWGAKGAKGAKGGKRSESVRTLVSHAEVVACIERGLRGNLPGAPEGLAPPDGEFDVEELPGLLARPVLAFLDDALTMLRAEMRSARDAPSHMDRRRAHAACLERLQTACQMMTLHAKGHAKFPAVQRLLDRALRADLLSMTADVLLDVTQLNEIQLPEDIHAHLARVSFQTVLSAPEGDASPASAAEAATTTTTTATTTAEATEAESRENGGVPALTSPAAREHRTPARSETEAALRACLPHLPSDFPKARLTALVGALVAREGDAEALIGEFAALAGDAGLVLRPLDKKKERNLLFSARQELLAQARAYQSCATCDPVARFETLLHLALNQHVRVAVRSLPCAKYAPLVEHLRSLVPPEAARALQAAYATLTAARDDTSAVEAKLSALHRTLCGEEAAA
eukprot:gnl/Trimastix_PCT/1714.p1 GENE.gnl/Trimastix_PCT/1714~~gnl/Trimastix_PCT/1714.p1  ORF type:complete len:926 (-),score=330.19 gnl/Trimastix_PCT/1714:9-2729(-)